MASKQVSPAAQLLRRSRLFSLPPNLPRPSRDQNKATVSYESDTATVHFPTSASIETTHSSRARGDWGFKRNLPLKSTTNTSTPVVRVKEVDNIDHITNYESAADHTLTLQKWQEMSLPIRQKKSGNFQYSEVMPLSPNFSVFDVFEPKVSRNSQQPQPASRRWRFKGPYLAGMDNVAFERFVEKQIKTRRAEFRQYLWNYIFDVKRKRANDNAMAEGVDSQSANITLTEDEFQTEVIRLRQGKEEIWRILWNFLDLPGRVPTPVAPGDTRVSEQSGPPITHPSAGLSYLRNNAHVDNHPLLGPQLEGPPVRGRVLQRGQTTTGVSERGGALVGLGGVVVGGPPKLHKGDFDQGGFHSQGGAKGWFKPGEASIDSAGRVNMNVKYASQEAIAVWENEFAEDTEQGVKEREDIQGLWDNKQAGSNGQGSGGGLFGDTGLLKSVPN